MSDVPTYIRPKVAYVDPGGADWGGLVLIAAGVTAAGAVLAFIAAHLVLLAVCLGVFVVVMGALAVGMRIAVSGRADLPAIEPQPAAPLAVQRAILAPQRALPAPAQHVHFHFHGLPAEDIAAIVRRPELPG